MTAPPGGTGTGGGSSRRGAGVPRVVPSPGAARFFQALGDETRLALLRELQRGERTVGDLVSVLGCPQPKVSRHLKVLREAGLVRDSREGRHVRYALAARSLWEEEARAWVEELDSGIGLGESTAHAEKGHSREEVAPRSRPHPPEPAAAPARRERRDLDEYLL